MIAEKSEAMVKLGLANSRMKDFYDLFRLARDYGYRGSVTVEALRATFERRKTEIPDEIPAGLTPAFSNDPAKQSQWRGFLKEQGVVDAEQNLSLTAESIWSFLQQPLKAAASHLPYRLIWPPGGPWQ